MFSTIEEGAFDIQDFALKIEVTKGFKRVTNGFTTGQHA